MIPVVPFTKEFDKAYQVKFELEDRVPDVVALHLIQNSVQHIEGCYFFDIDCEGLYFHRDVAKEIYHSSFDLRGENRLKVIGVDLL